MLTEEKLFKNYARRHYLSHLLSRIPLPAFWRATTAGLVAYLFFLLFTALSEWSKVISSFLHVWQITFSVTIFFGFWFGPLALNDFKNWLVYAGHNLGLNEEDFSKWVMDSLGRLGSYWSTLFSLPFILPALTIAFVIAQSSPSNLFPFSGFSPVFIYAVFLELCVGMLHLLGATGFWLLYTFTQAAHKMSQLKSVDYFLVDEETLRPLSDTVLRLCVYLLIIIASAMPGVAYVVFSFKGQPLILLLGTIFGMVLPTTGLTLSFFGPIYFLNQMLVAAKKSRIARFKEQIRICEDALRQRVLQIPKTNELQLEQDNDDLLKLTQFLHERLKETQRESEWPFDLSSLLRLLGSSMLPVVAFFAEQAIRWIFP